MLFSDTCKTISKPSEGIFRDRGSKFIGYAYPVKSDTEVKKLIADLRTAHAKARHFCWAFRFSPDRSLFRLNDDGEPSGTAGRPILNSLLSADLTDVLVVVVRYFGGTLLGVPGLINAYKTAAQEAISAADIVQKTVNDIYKLSFGYLSMNEVMRIIKEESLQVSHEIFDNDCSMEISVPKSQLNLVINKLEKVEGLVLKYISTN